MACWGKRLRLCIHIGINQSPDHSLVMRLLLRRMPLPPSAGGGGNENTIELLRRYFPQGNNFSQVSDDQMNRDATLFKK